MKLRATHWVRPARARDFARVEREAGLMLAACLPRLPSPPAGEELRDEGGVPACRGCLLASVVSALVWAGLAWAWHRWAR